MAASVLYHKKRILEEKNGDVPYLFSPELKSTIVNASSPFPPITDFSSKGEDWVKCLITENHSNNIAQQAILYNAHCSANHIQDNLVILSTCGLRNSPYFYGCDPNVILSTSFGNLKYKKFKYFFVPPYFAYDILVRNNRLLEMRALDLSLITQFTTLINYLFEVHSSTNRKFHQNRMNQSDATTLQGLASSINKNILFTPNSQTSQHENLSARLMAETINKITNTGTNTTTTTTTDNSPIFIGVVCSPEKMTLSDLMTVVAIPNNEGSQTRIDG